jgi:hydrogenase small subunit
MPFMNQPPGSILSTTAVMTYGKTIRALRSFTQASLNKEPEWRHPTTRQNETPRRTVKKRKNVD